MRPSENRLQRRAQLVGYGREKLLFQAASFLADDACLLFRAELGIHLTKERNQGRDYRRADDEREYEQCALLAAPVSEHLVALQGHRHVERWRLHDAKSAQVDRAVGNART